MMKIEYLILTKQNKSFCNNEETFLKFLQVDSNIEIVDNIINYNCNGNNLEVNFKFKMDNIPSKKEKYFHLELICDKDEKIEDFYVFSENIKENLRKIDPKTTKINTLWDDIGRKYAIKAYPLINEVENLMRKLLSQFMLVNVGMDWFEEAIHEDIKSKIENKQEEQDLYVDDLYKTDFIHLSDVLFKKYRTLSIEDLHRLLQRKEKRDEDINIEEIEGFIKKSNWERYFSDKIDYKEKHLKEKWKLLYRLRNNIAHNRYIEKSDFKKIKGLVKELKKVINNSIEELESINLGVEEKENLMLSYQPSHVHKGYIAEKAVFEWYMRKHLNSDTDVITTKNRDAICDFVLTLETGTNIGVEIKYRSKKATMYGLRNIIEQAEHFLDNNFDEIHLVIVLADYEKEVDFFSNIMNRLKQLGRSEQIKIIVGYLNNNDEFIKL